MLVGKRMSHPVITIHQDASVDDALRLMDKENIRRLPVVNDRGHMVGIICERDLIKAQPSEATTLDVWEQKEYLRKLKIDRMMTRDVITVNEDSTLEEAASIMADKSVSGLPVMRDQKIVGIITETDIFKLFLEILGAREPGIRMTVMVQNQPGKLFEMSKAIYELGGNIVAIGTFLGEDTESRELTLKVTGIKTDTLKKAIQPIVEDVVDMREQMLL